MNNNAVKWLYRVPGSKKLGILLLTVVQAVEGASGVVYAMLLRNVVDSAVDHNRNGFVHYILLVILLVIGQLSLRAVIRWLTEYSKSTFENIFKSRLMGCLLKKDFSRISAVHSGEWLNRLTSDTVVVADSYVDILPGFVSMAVKMISAFIMMIVIDYRFAYMMVPSGIALIVITYVFRKSLKKLHKNVQEKDGKLRIFLQERIGSMMMIRSFSAEKQTENEAADRMLAHKKARMKKNRFSNVCNTGFGIAMYGMYLFGIIYCGYGILLGTISYGTLTAVTQLISQIQAPFANITGYLPKFYAMTASAERLMEIEAFDDDCVNEPKSIAQVQEYYQDRLSEIRMTNVDYTYYPAVDTVGDISKDVMPIVLSDLSLSVRKGEYVAFTGHSGCGKSTILKLLMCIYRPDSGERFMTDKDGNKELLDPSWHRLFAYVPQGNQLMSGTVRKIITFAEPSSEHDDERIVNALKIACADEFINELENGVDTVLGERGTGLSEGQMQRIAVARAIFSESPVLLLDEATSALDEKTERELLENLRNMTDKTVVIITHRPAALSICDRILEITQDGIIEKNY